MRCEIKVTLSYLSIILTVQTNISFCDTFAVAVFVALALSRAIMSDISEVALADVRCNTVTVWLTPLLTIWFTLVATNEAESHITMRHNFVVLHLLHIYYA